MRARPGPGRLADARRILCEALELTSDPVQVSYLDRPPADVPARTTNAPSVCTFFADGRRRSFYADAPAHDDCEIGAFVYGRPAEGALGARLQKTIGWMEQIGYLAPGEAASIPRLRSAPAYAAYGPLGSIDAPPSVVLLFAAPKSLMWVVEAHRRAWPTAPLPPLLGRPMCAVVPTVVNDAPLAVSVGCAGSRVYTGMSDHELVVAIRGDALEPFVRALETVRPANAEVTGENVRRKQAARRTARR